jgi:hypothetical protein
MSLPMTEVSGWNTVTSKRSIPDNVCNRDRVRDASLDFNEDYSSCGILRGFCCGCFRFWCLCWGLGNLYFSHEMTKETLDTNEKCCWICWEFWGNVGGTLQSKRGAMELTTLI